MADDLLFRILKGQSLFSSPETPDCLTQSTTCTLYTP